MTAGPRATGEQEPRPIAGCVRRPHFQRVDRLNKFADRFSVPLSHALMLELDLMEAEPPQGLMDRHYNELKRQTELLRDKFAIK